MREKLTGLLLALLLCPAFAGGAESLTLIANVPEGSAFDAGYALLLVRGETKNWEGGVDARVALPSREAPNYERVAKEVFGMSGRGMQRLWFRLVFSGKVNAPTYLRDDAAVVRFVRDNVGAVGVIVSGDHGYEGIRTAAITVKQASP